MREEVDFCKTTSTFWEIRAGGTASPSPSGTKKTTKLCVMYIGLSHLPRNGGGVSQHSGLPIDWVIFVFKSILGDT